MIGKTISHYKILEKLGEGGMGVVYRAEDIKLRRTVALKFLSPQALGTEEEKARFIHEAQAAAALAHPGICTIHEIDESEGQTFIAMECVEGLSLKEKIASGPLRLDEAMGIAVQIAEGLQEAHEKGIVHRDIKSANVMVTHKGQAKVMDFGLAKLAGGTKVTKTGTTVGTIAYMSPEQARGEEVDHRSDVWSLGVILYEMLTGQLPFRGDYSEAVVYSILNEAPEPVTALRTGVAMELERIVGKALEKEARRRYQSAKEMLVDLKNVRDRERSEGAVPPSSAKPSRRSWRKVLVSAVVVLVIAVALVVGVRIQVGRQPAAVAEENSLAVMYFDNLAEPDDPDRLGEIAANLLITDLSESRFIQVVSSQRLYDILKLLGREGVKVIDRDIASEVAKKANARWMLLGSILQAEPEMILTAQLVDVSTGKAVASQRITGQPGEKIFSLVDKLTVEVKKDLSLPGGAQREPDPTVANVTTHSPEAYRYYLEAVEYENKFYLDEARESCRKALEFDSTFAMAYYKLWDYTSGEESDRALVKAVKYSRKATRKERAYIRVAQAEEARDKEKQIEELKKIVAEYPEEKVAFRWLGRLHDNPDKREEAIRYYRRAIEIDPLDKLSYNQLAYAYHRIGDLEESIWAINEYISIAPDEANPYDSRGDLYALNGKLNEAIASYEKALEIKPDFRTTFQKLGNMYLFSRQYEKAEEHYRKLVFDKNVHNRAWGRVCLACIPIYQGKFEEALSILDAGISADQIDQVNPYYIEWKRSLKGMIHSQRREWEPALEEARLCVEIRHPDPSFGSRVMLGGFLASSGRIEEAEEVARVMKEDIDREDPASMYWYWALSGIIELEKGNAADAVGLLEKAQEKGLAFVWRFYLALAYLELGRLDAAVSELEEALQRYEASRALFPILAVQSYYLLGLAYERSGWTEKAIEQYEEFLDIWKDADPGIEELEDAKARLARLKGAA